MGNPAERFRNYRSANLRIGGAKGALPRGCAMKLNLDPSRFKMYTYDAVDPMRHFQRRLGTHAQQIST
jgi:hypothetical protein